MLIGLKWKKAVDLCVGDIVQGKFPYRIEKVNTNTLGWIQVHTNGGTFTESFLPDEDILVIPH